MPQSLELRSVHLRVANLARSVNFYSAKLGLVAATVSTPTASLATSPEGAPLLMLTEDSSARAAPLDAAGLFHAAFLLPSRAALGRWLRHALEAGVVFDGFSDHGVSEAIYLTDPDGNGLEFYADRPQDEWPRRNGEIAMGTLPLDVQSLLAAGATEVSTTIAALRSVVNGRWGHLHLRVTDLDRSERFYASTLGVSLTQRFGSNARFLAADGYHHHIGLNTWGGVRQPQPANALGLIEAVFARADATTETYVRDPDQISIKLVPKF